MGQDFGTLVSLGFSVIANPSNPCTRLVAAGAGTLEEYGKCCDTVSVCFSKGLGAPIGSMLVGSEEVIHYARWIRKSIGGGMRQTGPIVNAARTAYRELCPIGILETHRSAKVIEGGTSGSSLPRILIVA